MMNKVQSALNSPYLTTATGLWDLLCSISFAYLLVSASAAIWTSHSLAARIDIFGWLVPHATKVILWAGVALFWLRPRFGWRYPFAMFMLYSAAEMITNTIYVGVHYDALSDVWRYHIPFTFFLYAQAFFSLGIILGYIVLKGRFALKADWAMLPFIFFVGSWVAMGYQTESTIQSPSYWLEAQELIWNVCYLIMVANIFRAKNIDHSPML